MTRRHVLFSTLAHGLVLAAVLLRFVPSPPAPPPLAQVELIQQPTPTVGNGPPRSGVGPADAPPAAPSPAPPTPPPSPPQAAQTAPDPAAAPSPPSDVGTAAPPPAPTAPPAEEAQATPSPVAPLAPPPQPETDLPEGAPAGGAFAIRLGEGGPAGTGLVENVIPAEPDSRIHNKNPAYPEDAARHREQGTVILMVQVKPDGSAASVEVRESSGHERLDRAAREAVARWQFRPALQEGVPVASEMPVRVRFMLGND